MCCSIYATTSFRCNPLSGRIEIKKPNQDGSLLLAGSGKINLSSATCKASRNLFQLCLLRSINCGNFFNCSQPIAAAYQLLQIIAKMTIHILMVITNWQLSVLPIKTMLAEVILPGWTNTIPSPVTETFY